MAFVPGPAAGGVTFTKWWTKLLPTAVETVSVAVCPGSIQADIEAYSITSRLAAGTVYIATGPQPTVADGLMHVMDAWAGWIASFVGAILLLAIYHFFRRKTAS